MPIADLSSCCGQGIQMTSSKYGMVVISFLDLEIMVVDQRLITCAHFKATLCNSCIPVDSCNHRAWLCLVPCSQFLRPRCNCTESVDYQRQALLLKDSFLQKGYTQQELNEEIEQVTNIGRDELPRERHKNTTSSDNFKWSLVTYYSVQHK